MARWLVGGIGVNGSRVANELAREADLIVCVGTRLTDFTTGSHSLFERPGVRFVSINVNAADAAKLSATPVVADAREALDALRREVGELKREDYEHDVAERRNRWLADLRPSLEARLGEPMGQGEVLRVLNEHVGAGDWIVAAAGYQPGDLLKMWDTPAGSYTHIEFGFSCMGHELPAGLGIQLQQEGSAEVFVLVGDGTFLMSPTELFTAVQERLKLTVVVLDNGGYQSINHLALANTGFAAGNEFRARGSDRRFPDGTLLDVDYEMAARSMGCESATANTPDELRAALTSARSTDRTTVIICRTASDRPLLASGCFWDLGVPGVANEATTNERVSDHRVRAQSQRYH